MMPVEAVEPGSISCLPSSSSGCPFLPQSPLAVLTQVLNKPRTSVVYHSQSFNLKSVRETLHVTKHSTEQTQVYFPFCCLICSLYISVQCSSGAQKDTTAVENKLK